MSNMLWWLTHYNSCDQIKKGFSLFAHILFTNFNNPYHWSYSIINCNLQSQNSCMTCMHMYVATIQSWYVWKTSWSQYFTAVLEHLNQIAVKAL